MAGRQRPDDAAAGWAVDARPLVGHTDSVEDIQWSPTEATVVPAPALPEQVTLPPPTEPLDEDANEEEPPDYGGDEDGEEPR